MILYGAANYASGTPSGLNRHTRELLLPLLKLIPELEVLTSDPDLAADIAGRARTSSPAALGRSDALGNLLRLVWTQTRLPSVTRRAGAELYFSPVPEGMLRPPCPQVVTVHDLVPLNHSAGSPRMRYAFRHLLPRVIEASAAVIVSSEATRREVERHFAPRREIHVVPLGYRNDMFAPQPRPVVERFVQEHALGRYALFVGADRPHKNLRRTIGAVGNSRVSDLRLVVVGARRTPELETRARAAGLEGRIHWLRDVPDHQLALLYAGAAVFVFPSLEEGFGIPPLEAMACECPVVASSASAVPEVCGDAAVYADPLSQDAMAEAIRSLVEDAELAAEMVRRGVRRSAGFTYTRVASTLPELLRGYAAA